MVGEESMFKFVHHVRILVHKADDMVDYLEKNFGMKPVKVQVYESRGMKNAIYKVGDTNLEFTEPLDPDSGMGKFLEREGPGIYHIAFGVDNLPEVARDLAAKGNKMRGQDGITRSAEGYLTANIDPESSLGFPFQIAEG
jgi:methylmalonyl-CoA/ethylmalonyl-CoA epimerase